MLDVSETPPIHKNQRPNLVRPGGSEKRLKIASNYTKLKSFGKLEKLATRDSLTGLQNRRSFLGDESGDETTSKMYKGILEQEIDRMLRDPDYRNKSLTVAMFDIDNFKEFNETHGHNVGDKVLQTVGRVVLDNIRIYDVGARYGGDEFVILIPNGEGLEHAIEIIERIRKTIKESQIVGNNGEHIKINTSFGMTNFTLNGTNNGNTKEIKDAVMKRADDALNRSKQDGKGQTTILLRRDDGKFEYRKVPIIPSKKLINEKEEKAYKSLDIDKM